MPPYYVSLSRMPRVGKRLPLYPSLILLQFLMQQMSATVVCVRLRNSICRSFRPIHMITTFQYLAPQVDSHTTHPDSDGLLRVPRQSESRGQAL
jgi:hypothetical protein